MIYLTIKTLKKMLKVVNSLAAPWQVFLGTLFGTLLGFWPICPTKHGPAPLGIAVLLIAIVINCHLGSVLMFFGLGWLIAKALSPVEVMVGESLDGLARWSADQPLLHMSLWSHTGYLGRTVLGVVFALVFAIAMWRFTIYFRTTLKEKLLARRKLVTTAGKVGKSMWLLRVACWFFDL